MAEQTINPAVQNAINDADTARVDDNAAQNMPRHFWSALKNGHYRFALAGAGIGGSIGAVIGATVAFVFAPASLLLVAAAFAGAGALMGAEGFGATGAAAASRASGLAEKHARILDADAQGKDMVGAADDRLMHNGQGHHYEFPITRDQGKLYSWKSGLTGAGVGAGVGAVVGAGLAALAHGLTGAAAVTAATVEAPIIGAIATSLATVGLSFPPVALLAIAGAGAFALFGLTLGVERSVLKSINNQTDANITGKLSFTPGQDLGRAQSQESDYALAQHRLRRQEEIAKLEKSYNEKISWGALSGRFRGFAGVVPGVLAGAALGAIALVAVAATGGLASAPVIAALVHTLSIPLFSTAGGLYGMKIFSESGTEAGAEATARAIDNEFDRNRTLRAQGITPPAPKEAEGKWFSPKAALVAAAVGAAAGILLTPALGMFTLAVAGIPITAATAGSVLTPVAIKASMLVSGLIGATYGIGDKTLKAMAKPFDMLYDKVAFSHSAPAQEQALAPQCQKVPVCETITAEEAARLHERLAATQPVNFSQNVTQQRAVTANAVAGV